MPIGNTSHFDQARRRLFAQFDPLPRRIGAAELSGEETRNDRIVRYLPYSLVTANEDLYVETNHTLVKVNSADAFDDLIYQPPVWGEIEAVEQAPFKTTINDPVALTVLHRFDPS